MRERTDIKCSNINVSHSQHLYKTGSKQPVTSISIRPLKTPQNVYYGIYSKTASYSQLLSVP